MPKAKIQLPSKIKEDSWFYKDNEELCKPHLGKPYISYSTVNSWTDEKYRADMIKQKFAGIELPGNIYSDFGSYLGEAVENGEYGDNPNGFTGQENFQPFLDDRPENAVYEKMILIDMGEYVIIGFIDIYSEDEESRAIVVDLKTGGKDKELYYESEDYIQVPLYAKAIELHEKKEIGVTGVWFVRRGNSHFKPPLHITEDQFFIELPYNEERAQYALDKIDKAVREISDYYRTYLKIFGDENKA